MFKFPRYEVRVTDDGQLTLRWRVATLGNALYQLYELHQHKGVDVTDSYVYDRWTKRSIHHTLWS